MYLQRMELSTAKFDKKVCNCDHYFRNKLIRVKKELIKTKLNVWSICLEIPDYMPLVKLSVCCGENATQVTL
jgi:hypothetical protein